VENVGVGLTAWTSRAGQGPGQPRGDVSGERRVADQDPVPEQAVDLVNQRVQVTVLGELAAPLTGWEQTARTVVANAGS
jgi:hypothetical protein